MSAVNRKKKKTPLFPRSTWERVFWKLCIPLRSRPCSLYRKSQAGNWLLTAAPLGCFIDAERGSEVALKEKIASGYRRKNTDIHRPECLE